MAYDEFTAKMVKKNTDLEAQLATVTAERDALAEEVQRRRLEVDALENETGLHEERRQFNARIARLEQELDALKADNQRLQSEILALDLLPHTQKLRRLEQERDKATDLIAHLRIEVKGVKAEREALKEWKKIILGTGTDQEAIIRMAATEYSQVAVECWRQKVEQLEQERYEYKRKYELVMDDPDYHRCCEIREELRRELAQARQAIGLMTTLKGDLEMNVNDPLGMMQQVHAHVTQQLHAAQAREERLGKGWNIMQSALCSIATPALGDTQQWKAQEAIRQINTLEETEEAP